MSIRKRLSHIAIAAMLVGVGVIGVANGALAAGDVDTTVQAAGITNVCTVDWGFGSGASPDVTIDWDGAALQWPTDTKTLGTFSVKISATGEPGNRICKMSSSNTAFLNGTTQLLTASALQIQGTANYGIQTSINFYKGQAIPLGNPGGGVTDPANQWSGHWVLEIDPLNNATLNQSAPAGLYTSIITVTVSGVAV